MLSLFSLLYLIILGPAHFESLDSYSLALSPAARFFLTPPSSSFLPFPLLLFFSRAFPFFHPSPMSGDTIVDLRQRAGDLAHRLGSLSHFMPAAQELLDIIHRLSSEILMRHNRKVGPRVPTRPLFSHMFADFIPRS